MPLATTRTALSLLAAAAVLSLVPAVAAHGGPPEGGESGMNMDMKDEKLDSYPNTYFSHPEHQGVMYAHVALMSLAWVVMLPVGEYQAL